MERGERRLQRWLEGQTCQAVPLDAHAIRHVNGPEADQPGDSPSAFTPRSQPRRRQRKRPLLIAGFHRLHLQLR